jgi:hypothetical protein
VPAWDVSNPDHLEAMLLAVPKAKADLAKPYQPKVREAIKDKRDPVRHAAVAAIGYLADATSIPNS